MFIATEPRSVAGTVRTMELIRSNHAARLDGCVVPDEPPAAPKIIRAFQSSAQVGSSGSTAAQHRGASRCGAVSVPGIWA
jgi:hypothetical protein